MFRLSFLISNNREIIENKSCAAEMVGRLIFKNLVNEILIINLLCAKCTLVAP